MRVEKNNGMNICIATGIYPPELGGPAEYAKNLAEIWRAQDHHVSVKVFSRFNIFPSGLRHIIYFFSILPALYRSDFVLALDTISCALPAVLASKLFGKKIMLRTGGDFLWEAYVERTGDMVLLSDVYKTRMSKFSNKEKLVMKIISYVLRNVDTIIWSTEYQKNIFVNPYGLTNQKQTVIENLYGPRIPSYEPKEKNFIAATRPLKWKNLAMMKDVFERADVMHAGARLDMKPAPHAEFLNKITHAYAVIIPTLGDISPNTILDAIRCGKPFIITTENGLTPRIKDIAVFVDPKNPDDIAKKVIWLCDEKNYNEQKKKVENFSFTHTWEDIAGEYMAVYKRIAYTK